MTGHEARKSRKEPFCWQSKATRRLIRRYFEPSGRAASALGVYDALTEIASDKESECFQMGTDEIAKRAGLSRRTAQPILAQLETFGFIRIEKRTFPGTNMDAPSVYTLLQTPAEKMAVGNDCTPVGNDCTPVGNDCTPVGNERRQRSLPTSEESEKNLRRKSEKASSSSSTTTLPRTGAHARPTVEQVVAYITAAGWPRDLAQVYLDKRNRTDPPWHLPATHTNPAKPIGPDWQADCRLFIDAWIEKEEVVAIS